MRLAGDHDDATGEAFLSAELAQFDVGSCRHSYIYKHTKQSIARHRRMSKCDFGDIRTRTCIKNDRVTTMFITTKNTDKT